MHMVNSCYVIIGITEIVIMIIKGADFMDRKFSGLEELLKNRVFRNFANISAIPRASFEEKQISDYLYKWAVDHKLEVIQDKNNNIFIRKAASLGYENAPTVLLQAHMDMVCVKTADSNHDFSKDPINLVLDGDMLSSGGKTTLGADDGIGMAYALAVLEAEDLPHPALEVLFTTSEEEDMGGALNFDASLLKAKYLINLDHAVENELLSGSCGGTGVKLFWQHSVVDVPADYASFNISIRGLKGGHSGEDIHRGHGNANVLLGRFLTECRDSFPMLLSEIKGGTFRLAIPSYADVTLSLPSCYIDRLTQKAKELEKIFAREYAATAPNLTITVSQTEQHKTALSPEDFDKITTAIMLSPNGISEMNGGVPGTVESSDNMGEIYLADGHTVFVYEVRASFVSTQEYLVRKISLLAELLSAKYETFSGYPGWAFNPKSPLRETAQRVFREKFSEDMVVTVLHAGLEVGCFISGKEDLDAISIGPNCWYFHSPSECTSVSSVCKTWEFLCALLAEGNDLPK